MWGACSPRKYVFDGHPTHEVTGTTQGDGTTIPARPLDGLDDCTARRGRSSVSFTAKAASFSGMPCSRFTYKGLPNFSTGASRIGLDWRARKVVGRDEVFQAAKIFKSAHHRSREHARMEYAVRRANLSRLGEWKRAGYIFWMCRLKSPTHTPR